MTKSQSIQIKSYEREVDRFKRSNWNRIDFFWVRFYQ